MFLRLTDINGNLILVNTDKVIDITLETFKQGQRYTVWFVGGPYVFVQETISEISLLLQAAGKVIK